LVAGLVRNAHGRPGGHHVTYELRLSDGTILRTRISHPVNKQTHGAHLWRTILRDQLVVTEDEFWACVTDKQLPNRGEDEDVTPDEGLPAALAYQLIHAVGVSDDEVKTMTLEQALACMTEHWSKPRGE
jgi:hypothetical protein